MSNIFWTLIIGAIAGWLAGKVVKGHGFGIWVDAILGIVGAFIGNFILGLFGIATFGIIGSLIASFVGAMILVLIISLFSGHASNAH
ncbi:MAG: Transglycosylase associated protein [Firmicutes bacterium]|nr:Transglycosylase associated protein [Bacillota bacterium]